MAVLLELAKELLDLGQGTRVLLLVLAVEQVGMQVGEQGVLGTIGRAEAVSQGVVGGRLGRNLLGWGRQDHLTHEDLGILELLHANQAFGFPQSRLAQGGGTIRQLGDQSIELRNGLVVPTLFGQDLGSKDRRPVRGLGQLGQPSDRRLRAGEVSCA